MSDIFRRGLTWWVRLHIPRDRQADAAKAMGAKTPLLRERWRSLGTRDRREALGRRDTTLAELRAELDDRLRLRGSPPLAGWKASWAERAAVMRERLANASDVPYALEEDPRTGEVAPWTQRQDVEDEVRDEWRTVRAEAGPKAASQYIKLATGTGRSIAEARDAWLAMLTANGERKAQTIAGYKAALGLLEGYLRGHAQLPSLAVATLDEVTRERAHGFVAWRLETVSPRTGKKITAATAKRELSSLSGLWRWAGRQANVANPWPDQTADMPARRRGAADDDEDETKRPYTPAELVTLLRATGADWAPNGGGYGPALWDAVRLALLTGCRANELAGLRCGDVLDGGKAIRIRGGKTANAKRVIPLSPPAQRVIKARLASLASAGTEDPLWPDVPPWGADGRRGKLLSTRFGKARGRVLSGSRGVDFHSFRRSFAAGLRDVMNADPRTCNEALITVLMGHAGQTLATRIYAPGALERDKRRAMDALAKSGLDALVRNALAETADARPSIVRVAPVARKAPPDPPPRQARQPARRSRPDRPSITSG